MRLVRATGTAAVVALVTVLGCSACSSDKKKDSPPASATTVAPESLQTDPATVATGLKAIKTATNEIATTLATDEKQAENLNSGIEPAWLQIEGTIKANDADAYITFEDNFAAITNAIEDNDASKAQRAAAKVAAAADAYLAQYPA